MLRFLAGVGSTLLLVAAGLFWFGGRAAPESVLPPMPLTQAQETEALPEAAPEAPARSREEKRFDRYDKDRDSIITREEYLVSRRKAFAKLDTNGDGRLGFDEWVVRTSTKFATADRDKSGSMNAAEFLTTAVKRKPRVPLRCPPPAAEAEEI